MHHSETIESYLSKIILLIYQEHNMSIWKTISYIVAAVRFNKFDGQCGIIIIILFPMLHSTEATIAICVNITINPLPLFVVY